MNELIEKGMEEEINKCKEEEGSIYVYLEDNDRLDNLFRKIYDNLKTMLKNNIYPILILNNAKMLFEISQTIIIDWEKITEKKNDLKGNIDNIKDTREKIIKILSQLYILYKQNDREKFNALVQKLYDKTNELSYKISYYITSLSELLEK